MMKQIEVARPFLSENRQTFDFLIGLVFTAAIVNEFFAIDDFRTRFVFSQHFSLILASLYSWRYFISRQTSCRDAKKLRFFILLMAMLPFVYWRCCPLRCSNFLSLCVLGPVWLYAVPMYSFFKFDLRQRRISTNDFFKRALLELFVLFPAWSCIWIVVLWGTGLVENWTPFYGC